MAVASTATQREIDRIAKDIVDLVEHANGPVLLHEIDRQVPGFSARPGPGYTYFVLHDQGETVLWEGMTKAGYKALRLVLNGRRVALQPVSLLPYFIEGVGVSEDNWMPVVLLPVRAANLDTPIWAMRVSAQTQQGMLNNGMPGYRPLTPRPVGPTADQFSL